MPPFRRARPAAGESFLFGPVSAMLAQAEEETWGALQGRRPMVSRMAASRAYLERRLRAVDDLDRCIAQLHRERDEASSEARRARRQLLNKNVEGVGGAEEQGLGVPQFEGGPPQLRRAEEGDVAHAGACHGG